MLSAVQGKAVVAFGHQVPADLGRPRKVFEGKKVFRGGYNNRGKMKEKGSWCSSILICEMATLLFGSLQKELGIIQKYVYSLLCVCISEF